MGTPRCYHQFCGLARALDHVGERWTLLMVRELLLGPRRYMDFTRALPGLTTNLLAKRLKQLEADGIVERRPTADARAAAYALTELGRGLEPVIMELGRWGANFMGAPERDDRLDVGWALISMKRRYEGGLSLKVRIEVEGRVFVLDCGPDMLRVEERDTDAADFELRASFESLRAWWFQGRSSRDLEAEGALELRGSRRAFQRWRRAMGKLP